MESIYDNKHEVSQLQKAYLRAIEKREKTIINKLVDKYRDSELQEKDAFNAVAVIAELRWAKDDIKPDGR